MERKIEYYQEERFVDYVEVYENSFEIIKEGDFK